MSWRNLPPAGHPVSLARGEGQLPRFSGYTATWVNSGTAALSLALGIARLRRPEVREPEVILPGYGCPDLVAAAVRAGVRPILVDVSGNDPGFDLKALATALTSQTVAIVAVCFLGIRERVEDLRQILGAWPGVMLVEDSAQWYPELDSRLRLEGDAVVLSFGRGKPVSLLGGGAMLVRDSIAAEGHLPKLEIEGANAGTDFLWKAYAYNFLRNPWVYGLLSRNPALRLGRTAFKPLERVARMDDQRLPRLAGNVSLHCARLQDTARRIHEFLRPSMDLPALLGARAGRLLRYPVLCANRAQRDELLSKLVHAGLGGSPMYQSALMDIEQVDAFAKAIGTLPGAREFAGRILTLPLHDGVDERAVREMKGILTA